MTGPLDLPADHPFGLHHLPYGAISTQGDDDVRLAVRVGDHALDLRAASADTPWAQTLGTPTLNAFLELGPQAWADVRTWLQDGLSDPARRGAMAAHLHPLDTVHAHLPLQVRDYVDFYASEHHATNVGRIFRPDGEPLTPNWKHLPIGYHGRSSTVVVSGTDVVRPTGQRKGKEDPAPVFGPSVRLDIEAELGFVVGRSTLVGTRVDVDDAADHLFGVALFNDWSARDIQAWEYVPLGPFLGKSFASSLAAWITPMAALEAARVPLGEQQPEPLPYLRGSGPGLFGLDITMEVRLNGTVVSRPPYRSMYWSPAQMLAHLTVNGAALSSGDLFASGTVSGDDPATRGSLLELTWSGSQPLALPDGSTRTFLEDGDTVTITATAPGPDGTVVGLAEVSGTILPAR
ncbi:fumarylacetoacetase [Ornithinimicrobium humiphilum]|uniref:fumarylacetoacetase n=1 Tax=Ornithinimicrobium humiphilum TaxID=125288 RepID=A0A543KQD8_9MICO|nr:fumarylacetoacetase [Ornithinimicrobium humiphilum]TQM97299.1 fumarylacetoacetate hydrolase [Ornithinimicrobium humiphilum]